MKRVCYWMIGAVLVFGMVGVTAAQDASAVQPHPASNIHVDPDGTLIQDGVRRFVFGAFRDPSDDWRDFVGVRDARINLTHAYHFETRKTDTDELLATYIKDARKYLRLAKENNVGVFLGLPRDAARAGDTKQIEAIVQALKDEPALWFWYLYDEPSYLKDDHVDELAACYNTIKQIDPHRVVVVVDNRRFDTYPFDRIADMVWIDRYPVPWGISPLGDALTAARSELPNLIAPWSVPMGGSGIAYEAAKKNRADKVYITDQSHRPSPQEIRAQVHTAIASGAKGIVWYWYPNRWHDLRRTTPAVWEAIREAGREIAMLEPALVSLDEVSNVKVTANAESRLRRLDKAYGGGADADYDYREHSQVLHWTRMHHGELFIGLVNAGYDTQVKVKLDLPFAFDRVTQFPQGYPVIERHEDGLDVQEQDLPVAITHIGTQQIELVMNEADVVVWRISPLKEMSHE